MAEPVSWLLIRAGWTVYAAGGSEIGAVDEVAGDENADIFDGLAIATSDVGKPKYVPAEVVTTITEGRVDTSLTPEQVAALGEYLEPASSIEIEPDDHRSFGSALAGDVREIEGDLMGHPSEQHEHSVNPFRRVTLYFKRRRGKAKS